MAVTGNIGTALKHCKARAPTEKKSYNRVEIFFVLYEAGCIYKMWKYNIFCSKEDTADLFKSVDVLFIYWCLDIFLWEDIECLCERSSLYLKMHFTCQRTSAAQSAVFSFETYFPLPHTWSLQQWFSPCCSFDLNVKVKGDETTPEQCYITQYKRYGCPLCTHTWLKCNAVDRRWHILIYAALDRVWCPLLWPHYWKASKLLLLYKDTYINIHSEHFEVKSGCR